MYLVKELIIKNIPLLEYVPQHLNQQPAPLAIFYHGWTNNKQQVAYLAHELMAYGFRVIAPDCYFHGRRLDRDQEPVPDDFFKVIIKNIEEFPKILSYYQNKNLIKDDFVAACGLSMGGITTCMLVTQFPWIKAFGVLMGTPKLQQYTKQLFHAFEEEHGELNQAMHEQMSWIYQYLKPYDLSQHKETLQERPIHFWHGKEDPVVPWQLTKEFCDEIKEEHLNPYLHLVTKERAGHKVPYMAHIRLAAFLSNCYTEKKSDIWPKTREIMEERFSAERLAKANYTID